jgi:pimeloyl-ACP methyl ester carboxylesterase
VGIPNSTRAIVRDSGHMIPMEQPAILAETIKSWLRNAVDIR